MRPSEREVEVEKDPGCGMNVEPNSAAGSLVHEGRTYYFCSSHCLQQFQEHPERYVKG